MSDKLLSIIVPAFNMELYLRRCLESVRISESLDFFEVLVVNDGSTDQTSAIAHEYAARFPGVFRVLDKENGHYGSCINVALKVATGMFVKILEADDWYDTEVFGGFLRFLQKFAGRVDVVYSNMACVDAEDRPLSYELFDYPEGRVFEFSEIAGKRPCRANTALCYRTQFVRDIGYCQPEGLPYTDNLWVMVPIAHVKRCAFFSGILYRYFVVRPGQSMSPAVWKQNVLPMVKVLGLMLDAYQRLPDNLAEANRAFAAGSIQNVASIVYVALFSHAPCSLAMRAFLSLDLRIQELLSDVHRRLGRIEVLNRLGGLPYVKIARKGWFAMALMWLVVHIVNLVGGLGRARTR